MLGSRTMRLVVLTWLCTPFYHSMEGNISKLTQCDVDLLGYNVGNYDGQLEMDDAVYPSVLIQTVQHLFGSHAGSGKISCQHPAAQIPTVHIF